MREYVMKKHLILCKRTWRILKINTHIYINTYIVFIRLNIYREKKIY